VVESQDLVMRLVFVILRLEAIRPRLGLEGCRFRAYCLETFNAPSMWLNKLP